MGRRSKGTTVNRNMKDKLVARASELNEEYTNTNYVEKNNVVSLINSLQIKK